MVNRFLGSGDEEAFHLLAGFSGRDEGGTSDGGGNSAARGAAGFVKALLYETFSNLTGSPETVTPEFTPPGESAPL